MLVAGTWAGVNILQFDGLSSICCSMLRMVEHLKPATVADLDLSTSGLGPAQALAPVLGANRDGSATAESARGLLITVMGELVLPGGRGAWTQTLIAVMDSLGIRDKATRQALARMEARNWLTRDRVGRRTRWILTDPFAQLLDNGAERIYNFGAEKREWDERWLVLAISVPEADRKLRYRMGNGLNWAGFGSLGHGLWISPWTEQEPVAVDLLERLGVDAVSFRSELGELGSGPLLARRAWDLPALRRQYEEFTELAALLDFDRDRGGFDGASAAGRLAGLVHEWRRFPFLDPDLPSALLPVDWPSPDAAARFAQQRSMLLPAARDWWTSLESNYTS